jgi:hypothetical protein
MKVKLAAALDLNLSRTKEAMPSSLSFLGCGIDSISAMADSMYDDRTGYTVFLCLNDWILLRFSLVSDFLSRR